MIKKLVINKLVFIIICFNFLIFNTKYCYSLQEFKVNFSEDRLEKHWWGYRRYISNEQISKFSNEFDVMASELSLFGGLCLPVGFVNPIAGVLVSGVLELYSSYFWFISTSIVKCNRGNGVIVDFTKGIIFSIKPI